MIDTVKYIVKEIVAKIRFQQEFKKKTGIGFYKYVTLFRNKPNYKARLLGREIQITDTFWHLHSLNELFIDSHYEFKSKRKDPLIIDCGANVGISVIFFKQLFPSARIKAYEADPSIFNMLKSNISNFNFSDVEIENKAVWIENSVLQFDATGSLGGNIKSNGGKTVTGIPVEGFKLKDLLDELACSGETINLLKMDIEGAELEVLKDCMHSLAHVENIFIEYHRRKGEENCIGVFLTILETAGFRLYIKEAWNNLPKPFLYNAYNPYYDLQLNIFGFRLS